MYKTKQGNIEISPSDAVVTDDGKHQYILLDQSQQKAMFNDPSIIEMEPKIQQPKVNVDNKFQVNLSRGR